MTRFSIFTTLSLLLVACTSHGMSGSAAMGDRLAEAEEELDRHHGVVMNAASLPDVVDEASAYESKMARVMDGMDEAMGGMMSHCSGSRLNEMHGTMSGMRAETHDHAGGLEDAVDVRSAQTLCAAHVAEMGEMLSSMHDALGRAGCPMGGIAQ